ncbi:MAG: energy-coupling factor transporter ATPase [Ruminococcaceae bacterium]|nr:energy-coupling factor transporter ATPase [Oscillospiraceae bacterium]
MAEIKLENISYVYSEGTPFEISALEDINLTIKSGIVMGIIGHTGSGKSTLVQMLNGLVKPASGRVLLDGKDIWENPKEIGKVRFKVGLVMQYPEYQLFEETVRADIAFGPKNMGLDDEEIEERVLEAADFVGLERDFLEKSPFDLSGGQKRRVAIAGIIAMRPEVLVLDEPAAGLDPSGRETIMRSIMNYKKRTGATIVIVSHSMEDMAKYCDELAVLSDGKLLMTGDKKDVFKRSDELVSVGLDIPQITTMMKLLADGGVNVNTAVYTVDDALAEIYKLL